MTSFCVYVCVYIYLHALNLSSILQGCILFFSPKRTWDLWKKYPVYIADFCNGERGRERNIIRILFEFVQNGKSNGCLDLAMLLTAVSLE